MGNQTQKQKLQPFVSSDQAPPEISDLSSEIVFIDQIDLLQKVNTFVCGLISVSSDVTDQSEYIGSNSQNNSEIEDMTAYKIKKAYSDAQRKFTFGFKGPQSIIEELTHPEYETNFVVIEDNSGSEDMRKVQIKKSQLLYLISVVLSKKGKSKQLSFQDVLQEIMTRSQANFDYVTASQMQSNAGLLLVLLKELRSLNSGQILVNALNQIYVILKDVKDGAFKGGEDQKMNLLADLMIAQSGDFLSSLVKDTSLDSKVKELSLKILIQIAITRNSAREFMSVCHLLLTQSVDGVDLRDEIAKMSPKLSQNLSALMESKETERDLVFENIKSLGMLIADVDVTKCYSYIVDGPYCYVLESSTDRLRKYQSGLDGKLSGRCLLHTSLPGPVIGSMVLFKGKLYLRIESTKDRIIVIDTNTLEEIKTDPEIKFEEPKDESSRSLYWFSSNEEIKRQLAYSPLIQDGKLIYVISERFGPKNNKESGYQSTEEYDPHQRFVLESYDPEDQFKFVREVNLEFKDFETQKESSHDVLNNSYWFSNGKLLIRIRLLSLSGYDQTKSFASFYDLATGKLISHGSNSEFSNGIFGISQRDNRLINILHPDFNRDAKIFEIKNFSTTTIVGEAHSETQLVKQLDTLLKKQEENSSQIDCLMKAILQDNLSSLQLARNSFESTPLPKEIEGVITNRVYVGVILRYMALSVEKFQTKLAIYSKNQTHSALYGLFKYPNLTHPTASLFNGLKEVLAQIEKVLKNPESSAFEMEIILDGLNILLTNYQALQLSQLSLTDLLPADHQAFSALVSSWIELIANFNPSGLNNPQKDIGHQIKKVGLKLQLLLANKQSGDSSHILDSLLAKVSSTPFQDPRIEIEHVIIQMDKMVDSDENIDKLLKVYSILSKSDITFIKERISSISLIDGAKQDQIEQIDQTLRQQMVGFLRNLEVQIGIKYFNLNETTNYIQIAYKSSKSEEEQRQLNKLNRMASIIDEILSLQEQQLLDMNNSFIHHLEEVCRKRKEEDNWDGMEDKYKKYQSNLLPVLLESDRIHQNLLSLSLFQHKTKKVEFQLASCFQRIVSSFEGFYQIWKQYGEKLGLEKEITKVCNDEIYQDTLAKFIEFRRTKYLWFLGNLAYQMIKIEHKEEKDKEKEEDKGKKKAKELNERMKLVLQSNLLAGGIDPDQLDIISDDTKLQITEYLEEFGNSDFLKSIKKKENNENSLNMCPQIQSLDSIIEEGKDAEIDKAIKYLQRILTTKIPMVTYANVGGSEGMRLSRIAFAVMIKFSDLSDDFLSLVSEIEMQEQIDEDPKAVIKVIKESHSGETIIQRWESASRMRIWIQEKKKDLTQELENTILADLLKKKKSEFEKKKKEDEEKKQKEEEEKQKIEEEKKDKQEGEEEKEKEEEKEEEKVQEKEEEQTEQIEEKVTKKGKGKKKEEKTEEKKEGEEQEKKEEEKQEESVALTSDEKLQGQDEAFTQMEKQMKEIFAKILDKAKFMVRLAVPEGFKKRDPTHTKDGHLMIIRAPTNFDDIPEPKADWEERLKLWNQMQTSGGAIKSFTERSAEVLNSGILSILALLQTSIERKQIQEHVERTYLESCRRAVGLKIIKETLQNELPWFQFKDQLYWFCSSLRLNKNVLASYQTIGQGTHLEMLTRKYFFEILNKVIVRLKHSKSEEEVRILVNSLKWKYIGRDHSDLVRLNIFGVLHIGDNEKENILKKVWGRRLEISGEINSDQPLPSVVIEMFEMLFLAVAGRIVSSDSGDQISLKKQTIPGSLAPQLQKSKSVLDEKVSDTLLNQALEVIFKEMQRYISNIQKFDGVDWESYVTQINLSKKQEQDIPEGENQDGEEEGEEEGEAEQDEDDGSVEEDDSSEDEDEEVKDEEETEEPKQKEEEEVKNEKKEEQVEEEKSEGSDEKSDKTSEDEAEDEEVVTEEDPRGKWNEKKKTRDENEVKRAGSVYSESFLIRLLALVELFTSTATCSSHPLSMVQRVANPYHLSTLLHLLLIASPHIQVLVIRILQHITRLQIPFEVFEEATNILSSRSPSAHKLLKEGNSSTKFEKSTFLHLIFNMLLTQRRVIWSDQSVGNQSQYSLSQILSNTLREICSIHCKKDFWREALKNEISWALKNIETLSVEEADTIMSLVPGGEFGSLVAGQYAITSKKQVVLLLGYSKNWLKAEEVEEQRDIDFIKKIQKMEISAEFTNQDQMAVGLFCDPNQKQMQEIMVLSPAQLTPCEHPDADVLKDICMDSPVMDSVVLQKLISILVEPVKRNESARDHAKNRQIQAQILKVILNQINVLGSVFIKKLTDEGVLSKFIEFLLVEEKQDSGSQSQIISVNWLETKLQLMRKVAIESNLSLQLEQEQINCTVLFERNQLVFQMSDKDAGMRKLTAMRIISAINYKQQLDRIHLQLISVQKLKETKQHQEKTLKQDLVMIPQADFEALNKETLSVINQSFAVIIPQTASMNLQKLFDRLVSIQFKDCDKKQPNYPNLLKTVYFFVEEGDFKRLETNFADEFPKEKTGLESGAPIDRFLNDLQTWGKMDEETVMKAIQKSEVKDLSTFMSCLEEGLQNLQKERSKFQADMDQYVQSKDQAAITKLLQKEEERKKKVEKQMKEIQEVVSTLRKQKETQNCQNYNEQVDYSFMEIKRFKNQRELIKDSSTSFTKMISESENQKDLDTAKTKNEQEMRKLYAKVINNFDHQNLALEHSSTIEKIIANLKNQGLFLVITKCPIEEITRTKEQFIQFLKRQFNKEVVEMLQTGQKFGYQEVKKQTKNFLSYLMKNESGEAFVKEFVEKDVIAAGLEGIKELQQGEKNLKVLNFFGDEKLALKAVNPYFIRFICKLLIKEDPGMILRVKHGVTNFVNLLLMNGLIFNQQNSALCKFTKQTFKLLNFASENLKNLIDSEQIQELIQNKLIKEVTSKLEMQVGQSTSQKFQNHCIILIEIHILLDHIQETVLKQFGLYVGKILEDSQSMSKLKMIRQSVMEGEKFNLVKYNYFLNKLGDEDKKRVTVRVETNHPAFDCQVRAQVWLPQVMRMTVKFKDSMKLKDFTKVGLSVDQTSEMQLLREPKNPFDWSSGHVTITYPVQKQCLIGMGENERESMGKPEEAQNFKYPVVCESQTESGEFIPETVFSNQYYSIVKTKDQKLWETGELSGQSRVSTWQVIKQTWTPKLVSLGPNGVVVVTTDNKLMYKGLSEGYWFPNNEGKSTFQELKVWNDQDEVENIVSIDSGNYFTIFVTESGKVWGIGQKLLEILGSNATNPVQLNIPKGHKGLRCWASKDPSSDQTVCFLELLNETTGKKILFSAGKCQKGLLGQGDQVSTSNYFSKLSYNFEETIFETISVYSHALAIDQQGQIWGWGHNEQNRIGLTDVLERGISKPMLIYTLNGLGMKTVKVSAGRQHSLVLLEREKSKRMLYSLGSTTGYQYSHLDTNEENARDIIKPYREISIFNDRTIIDFSAGQNNTLVVIQGGDTGTENLYTHTLDDGRVVQGLLHMFKKDGVWVQIPHQDVKDGKEVLPNICLTIRCPVEKFGMNEWPDLEQIEKEWMGEVGEGQKEFVNTITKEKVEGVAYLSNCIINNEEVEVIHDDVTLEKNDSFQINPLIFYRISKPIKSNARLPTIHLDKFYKLTAHHGIDIEFEPDLTLQQCDEVIKLNQSAWDEIQSEDFELKKKARAEIYEQTDKQLSTVAQSKSDLTSINLDSDLKVGEMTFNEKSLKKRSDKAKKQKISFIWMLNNYFLSLIPLNCKLLFTIPDSFANLISKNKHLMLPFMKQKIMDQLINEMSTGSCQEIQIKRNKALRFRESGECDHKGEHTIFGQIFKKYVKDNNWLECWKQNQPDNQVFRAYFAGEGAIDAGGPFRDTLSNLVEELESDSLPLLIKTTNNRNDHGNSRDCFTLNPTSITPTHQQMFNFLGVLIGYTIRSQSVMNWHFPPLIWKLILGDPVDYRDLREIDTYSFQVLKDIKKFGRTTPEEFDMKVNETFTTYLSNGKQIELCEGGKEKQVTHENYKEFIELIVDARLNECKKQMEWVKHGIDLIIPTKILTFLSWEEVEVRARGRKEITVDALKACSNNVDTSIKELGWFWEIFEEFTQDQRRLYLKFVWGRSNLPQDPSSLYRKHQLNFYSENAKDSLPEAHTCFFSIDIPPYSSKEIMKDRFIKSIELCGDIDGDHDPEYIQNEDEDRRGLAGEDSY